MVRKVFFCSNIRKGHLFNTPLKIFSDTFSFRTISKKCLKFRKPRRKKPKILGLGGLTNSLSLQALGRGRGAVFFPLHQTFLSSLLEFFSSHLVKSRFESFSELFGFHQLGGPSKSFFRKKLGIWPNQRTPHPPPRKLGRQKKKNKFNVYFAF